MRMLAFIACLSLAVTVLAPKATHNAEASESPVTTLQAAIDGEPPSTVKPTVEPTPTPSAHPVVMTPVQQLQAFVEAAMSTPTPTPEAPRVVVKEATVVKTQVISTSSHQALMEAAGIAASDYAAVEYIVAHESGWNATVWNRGGSGAYGLGQALGPQKMAPYGDDYMTNPVTQLRWADDYAKNRYGGWQGAHAFWQAKHWW